MVDTDDTRRTTDDGRRTTDDGRRTTPRVWHKLPTGELKKELRNILLIFLALTIIALVVFTAYVPVVFFLA